MQKYLSFTTALVLLLVCFSCGAYAAPNNYLDYVSEAVAAMETGKYDEAVKAVDKAFALDANEPLAHTILATIFAHTNRVDAAIKEYRAALSLAGDYPLATYGLALCSLSKGKRTEAQLLLSQINGQTAAFMEVGPTKAYLEALSGSFKLTDQISPKSEDALIEQLAAIALFKRGKPDEAETAMKSFAAKTYQRGYYEPLGAVGALDKASVAFTGPALKQGYTPPKLDDDRLPKVSGTVTLRADLTKAGDVEYVLFYVDTRMVAIVNHTPHEYEWNTLNVPNGPHTVKIVGNSNQGIVLSQKTMRVKVANAKPLLGGAIEGAQVEQIAERVWNCIKLKPSSATTHYTLGKLALARQDKQTARDCFEKTMAVNPNYQDVRSQLLQIIGKLAPKKSVWGVPDAGKVIALTFDDGPNGGTDKILRILADNGVKATFFVVGSQVEAHSEVLRQIDAQGHDIQNHTYTHRALEYVNSDEIEKEVFKTNAVIKDTIGKKPNYLRCPHGRLNEAVGQIADKYGFTRIFWTINASKYEGSVPVNIVNYVSAKAENGAIVLMHNVEDVTLMALPDVIKQLKAKGFKFVTVSELLAGR